MDYGQLVSVENNPRDEFAWDHEQLHFHQYWSSMLGQQQYYNNMSLMGEFDPIYQQGNYFHGLEDISTTTSNGYISCWDELDATFSLLLDQEAMINANLLDAMVFDDSDRIGQTTTNIANVSTQTSQGSIHSTSTGRIISSVTTTTTERRRDDERDDVIRRRYDHHLREEEEEEEKVVVLYKKQVGGRYKPSVLELDEIQKHFNVPIAKAAKELGVGLTVLKKRCRELNIKRWPHRKIKSLNSLIHNAKELGLTNEMEMKMLEEHRRMLKDLPDLGLTERTKQLRQACFKANYKRRRLIIN